MRIASEYNLSPFDVMKADKDSVIMMINYFVQKQEALDMKKEIAPKSGMIKVTNETATGDWW